MMSDDKKAFYLNCGVRTLAISERTHIMGILNMTPDSFYDGGRISSQEQAVEKALQMIADGADIIDIGGESTRPGSETVDTGEELNRVLPVIRGLRTLSDIPISIDTRKAQVAGEALEAGANIVNDISAMRFDPQMAELVSSAGVPVILMHMKGEPKTMQDNPVYDDLMKDIIQTLKQRVLAAWDAGIDRRNVVVDPGIGFGKNWQDNFLIIRKLRELEILDCPILMGVSRKSFIGNLLQLPAEQRLFGTASAVAACVLNGAHILRVHDVREMAQVIRIADRIKEGGGNR